MREETEHGEVSTHEYIPDYQSLTETDEPLINCTIWEKGHIARNLLPDKILVFILSGSICVTLDTGTQYIIGSDCMIYVPADCYYKLEVLEKARCLQLFLNGHTSIYACSPDEYNKCRHDVKHIPDNNKYILNIKPILQPFIDMLLMYIQSGIDCRQLYQVKIQELFYILNTTYSKQELSFFFYHDARYDQEFITFIQQNWLRYKTSGGLASALNCSVSEIDRKFRRNFGESYKVWRLRQLKAAVYRLLLTTRKPIKEICYELEFSSPSYLTSFCQRYLCALPSEIRKKSNDIIYSFH